MPSVPGFLRTKPKIDEGEAVLAESRLVARLAGLFGDEVVEQIEPDGPDDAAAIVEGAPGPAEPSAQEQPTGAAPGPVEPAGEGQSAASAASHRPPIIVIGGPPLRPHLVRDDEDEPDRSEVVDGVGVMAQPDEGLGPDGWRLPDRPAAAPRRAPAAPPQPAHRRPPASGPAERATKRVLLSAAHCPYCGTLLDPPPPVSRRCDECRQRIIVKRVDGRTVFLAAAALPVFTAERQRAAQSARLIRERGRWLELARSAGAPSLGIAQVLAARPTETSVGAARSLYLAAIERTFRVAKRDHEWDAAARLRREQAMTIYRIEGSSKPPSAEVVALFREGVASELRGISEISRDAQLVAADCCDACRRDDEAVTRIAVELHEQRLPHAGCPKGLCRCHWDLAARDRAILRRYLRRRPISEPRPASTERSKSR